MIVNSVTFILSYSYKNKERLKTFFITNQNSKIMKTIKIFAAMLIMLAFTTNVMAQSQNEKENSSVNNLTMSNSYPYAVEVFVYYTNNTTFIYASTTFTEVGEFLNIHYETMSNVWGSGDIMLHKNSWMPELYALLNEVFPDANRITVLPIYSILDES